MLCKFSEDHLNAKNYKSKFLNLGMPCKFHGIRFKTTAAMIKEEPHGSGDNIVRYIQEKIKCDTCSETNELSFRHHLDLTCLVERVYFTPNVKFGSS